MNDEPDNTPGHNEEKTDRLMVSAVMTRAQVERVEEALERLRSELLLRTHELAAERSRLRAVIDGMADGMLALDSTGQVVVANANAADLLECTLDELQQTRADQLPAALQPALDTSCVPEAFSLQLGPRVVRVVPAIYGADEEHGVVLVLQDVTREAELDRLKTELVSLVSHELRAPLASIKGYVELLVEDADNADTATRREFLGIVREKSQTLLSLVNDLLDLDRIAAGRYEPAHEPVDVNYLVQAACVALRPTATSADVTLKQKPDRKQELLVAGDPGQLERVLVNLVSNALAYTPAGGQVTVAAAKDNGKVRIDVTDTGCGIAADQLPRLFDRFYRVPATAGQVKGTGLGLAIVKAICDSHGARLEVESTPEKGSRFTIFFQEKKTGTAQDRD